ncbi:hypothetical protein NQ317_016748 [Molorchus minor]|uniref:Uncharacterized protein n=1 Tax=Molorchus minor TaxID=1323400 RepID=A0ABQ9J7I4_9CUCU|nr:hypothetical protein NQ317_016748 [Molorchus minor]
MAKQAKRRIRDHVALVVEMSLLWLLKEMSLLGDKSNPLEHFEISPSDKENGLSYYKIILHNCAMMGELAPHFKSPYHYSKKKFRFYYIVFPEQYFESNGGGIVKTFNKNVYFT